MFRWKEGNLAARISSLKLTKCSFSQCRSICTRESILQEAEKHNFIRTLLWYLPISLQYFTLKPLTNMLLVGSELTMVNTTLTTSPNPCGVSIYPSTTSAAFLYSCLKGNTNNVVNNWTKYNLTIGVSRGNSVLKQSH